MLLKTPCTIRVYRPSLHRTQWHRLLNCQYSIEAGSTLKPSTSLSSNPEWFQKLREQMLSRKLPPLYDIPSKRQEDALASTLSSYLPVGFKPTFRSTALETGATQSGAIGNHLVFFNPTIPTDELLSDGTDLLHSPGEPFVRRMWTGGTVKIHPPTYFQPSFKNGWGLDLSQMCIERIKEVTLRGQGDSEKIFVTIERRIASIPSLKSSMAAAKYRGPGGLAGFFREQARKTEESWGDAYLIEERNLVFMREKSEAEREAIKAGQIAPVKYLKAPGKPQFHHTIVPTKSLLFRFSALTFNAHAIHLDNEYCRTVEGHRNLLVHGPLTLMLMLKFMASHLRTLHGSSGFIQSIEYRNLAPLYCDEQLRLCGRERERLNLGEKDAMFDVWIEGPTGGVAVKGTVVTESRTKSHPLRRKTQPSYIHDHASLLHNMESVPLPEPKLPIVPDNNAALRKVPVTDIAEDPVTKEPLHFSRRGVRKYAFKEFRIRKIGERLQPQGQARLPWR